MKSVFIVASNTSQKITSMQDEVIRYLYQLGYVIISLTDRFQLSDYGQTTSIVSHIRRADLIVALVEEFLPNVYFELGCAMALGKPLLVVSASDVEIPANFSELRSLRIDMNRPEAAIEVVKAIDQSSSTFLTTVSSPSVVYGQLQSYRNGPLDFDLLSADEFLEFVWYWFQEQDCRPILINYGHGFDIALRAYHGKALTLVEAKKHERSTRVSIGQIQHFVETVNGQSATCGIMITTGEFTASALDFAAKCTPAIELWTVASLVEKNAAAVVGASRRFAQYRSLTTYESSGGFRVSIQARDLADVHYRQANPDWRKTEQKRGILVVEPEPSIARAAAIWLNRSGYNVFIASSGAAALDIVRRRNIDMMISELRIPDMRSDILLQQVVQAQPHLAKATLLITGDVTESAMQLLEAAECPVLMKPFDLHDLRTALESIMEHSTFFLKENQ